VNHIEDIVIDDKMYLKLLNLLREKTGLNFEYYRRPFIEKRIKSRMIRVNSRTLNEYYDYLLLKDGEVKKFVDGFTGSSDPHRRKPDISRAKKILKWEPQIELIEGLEITIPYFKTKLGLT